MWCLHEKEIYNRRCTAKTKCLCILVIVENKLLSNTSHYCVLSRRETRFGLQTLLVRFTKKVIQSEPTGPKEWNVDGSLNIITWLVRFALLPIITDIWRPRVASLLVENTQRKLLDIMWTSKWFGLPQTTLLDYKHNSRPFTRIWPWKGEFVTKIVIMNRMLIIKQWLWNKTFAG